MNTGVTEAVICAMHVFKDYITDRNILPVYFDIGNNWIVQLKILMQQEEVFKSSKMAFAELI